MKIAISGASGLIGTALARSLRLDGHEVLPLVRRPVTEGEPAVRWDPDAGAIDGAALEGVDAVVHLAGAGIGDHRWTDDYKRQILESRTKSTDLLARTIAALDRPPAVMVSGSAIGIYGDTGDDAVTEDGPHGRDFLADVCERWEASAAPATEAGIRVAQVRTGIVLSPHGGALSQAPPAVPSRRRWPHGIGPAVVELDHHRRRGRCHPLAPGERGDRTGERHRP